MLERERERERDLLLTKNCPLAVDHICLCVTEYKRKMKEAGVEAESLTLKGTIHGFFSQPGTSTLIFFIFFRFDKNLLIYDFCICLCLFRLALL